MMPEHLLLNWLAKVWPWYLVNDCRLGSIYSPDYILRWRDGTMLLAECDGYEFHKGRFEFERDRAKDRHFLTIYGTPTMRFTASEISANPAMVCFQIIHGMAKQIEIRRGRRQASRCLLRLQRHCESVQLPKSGAAYIYPMLLKQYIEGAYQDVIADRYRRASDYKWRERVKHIKRNDQFVGPPRPRPPKTEYRANILSDLSDTYSLKRRYA